MVLRPGPDGAMNKHQELAFAIADKDLPAVNLIPIIRSVIQSGDSRLLDLSESGLLTKCFNIRTDREWSNLSQRLTRTLPGLPHLQHVAMLGRLFLDYSITDRDLIRRDCIVHLIRVRPHALMHLDPPVSEIADEFFADGAKEWRLQVYKHQSSPSVIKNAAMFFFRREQMSASELYRRGELLEPDNMWWGERLSLLNAFHLGG